jgi:hypothetical protein
MMFFAAGSDTETVQALDSNGQAVTVTASRYRNGNSCTIVATISVSG